MVLLESDPSLGPQTTLSLNTESSSNTQMSPQLEQKLQAIRDGNLTIGFTTNDREVTEYVISLMKNKGIDLPDSTNGSLTLTILNKLNNLREQNGLTKSASIDSNILTILENGPPQVSNTPQVPIASSSTPDSIDSLFEVPPLLSANTYLPQSNTTKLPTTMKADIEESRYNEGGPVDKTFELARNKTIEENGTLNHGCYPFVVNSVKASGMQDPREPRAYYTNGNLMVEDRTNGKVGRLGIYNQNDVDLSRYTPLGSGLRIDLDPKTLPERVSDRIEFINAFIQNGLPKMSGVWITCEPESINSNKSSSGIRQDWAMYMGHFKNEQTGEETLVFRNQNNKAIFFSATEGDITYGGQFPYVKAIFATAGVESVPRLN